MAPAEDEQRWQNWVDELCESLGVDPSRVDIPAVLGLTREIAHRFDRPMAPVGSFMLGMALASNPDASVDDLVSRIEASLPAGEGSAQ